MLDLYIATKMKVLNSITWGGLQGNFTYVGFHDCSRVDLVVASEISLVEAKVIH